MKWWYFQTASFKLCSLSSLSLPFPPWEERVLKTVPRGSLYSVPRTDCFPRDHLCLGHFIYRVNGRWLLAGMEEYFA